MKSSLIQVQYIIICMSILFSLIHYSTCRLVRENYLRNGYISHTWTMPRYICIIYSICIFFFLQLTSIKMKRHHFKRALLMRTVVFLIHLLFLHLLLQTHFVQVSIWVLKCEPFFSQPYLNLTKRQR